jgi:hypothetical protein
MITSLTGTAGVTIYGGLSPPYINMTQPSAGMVRYNGSSQLMEVYDGTVWLQMGSHPTIQLDARVQEILYWAEKKMREDQELEKRMEQHPGLRDAYEKFKVMDVLTQENDNKKGIYTRA